jgi:hypothetical protein
LVGGGEGALFVGGKKFVGESIGEGRGFFVEFSQFRLFGFREVGAGVHKVVVIVLHQAERFGIEFERCALLVDRGYACEKLCVEENEILVSGELGSLNGFHFLQGGVGICAGDSIEDGVDAIEQLARLLHSDNRVFKGGRLGAAGDSLDFGLLLRDPGFDRRLKVFILDLVKGRSLEGQRAGRVERIGGTKFGGCGGRGIDGAVREGSGRDKDRDKDQAAGECKQLGRAQSNGVRHCVWGSLISRL